MRILPNVNCLVISGRYIPLPLLSKLLAFYAQRSSGPTDKAPDYGSGDSRFESWLDRYTFFNLLKKPLYALASNKSHIKDFRRKKNKNGGPGHRSRYLSHAKRALYHLS